MKGQPLEKRFWDKVQRTNRCWFWTGATNGSHGRGIIHYKGRLEMAPRISWLLAHGTLPPRTLYVLHTCDEPACVRSNHLFLGTQADNLRDASLKGRLHKTYCKRGHPLKDENLLLTSKGERLCRTCRCACKKRMRERKKVAS